MAAVAAAFAGKAVATSVISYIINKAFDHLKDNKKAGGLESTKARLEKLLPQIQVIFDAIDTEQIRDQTEALDAWLWQLRDATEEAEDALDELEYYKLKDEVKSRDNKVGGSLHKYKGKFVQQYNHAFNTGSLKRLKSAVTALDDVAAGVERFLSALNQLDNMKKYRQDVDFRNRQTSSLPESKVLGREEERNFTVDWLTKAENSTPGQFVNNIPIFSIIGIGGLGKTTLAQVICNDDKVKNCFNLIIWVCVSHDFDVETLTRKILQDVTREQVNMVGLNALHKVLMDKLSSQTFLLVLDDVWNDDRVDVWENFVRPLRYGKRGSKILLTTRMQSVADIAARAMQGECHSLKLSGLEETDLLFLLNSHAFFCVNPDDYINLQQISKKMVKKLSGSPLAAKVLGGLLNNNRDSSTWNRILALDIYNIKQGKEGIMTVLRLSYQHLPTHLQACFRYCSLFPKDYEFTKTELVHLWMGSGLIQQVTGNMTSESMGMEYLDTLTRKSFFDVKSRPRSSRYIKCTFFQEYHEERYVIHDLLHDLASSASVKECVRIDGNFSEMIPNTVRHMCVEIINPIVAKQISQATKLRTLIMFFQEQDEAAQRPILNKMLTVAKSLRVLSLTTNSICKLPNEFDGLVHLRYLSLIRVGQNTTHFSWFPRSVYKLYHLEILKYDDPHLGVPVKGEMDGLFNLVSLRHLLLPHLITPMIPNVGKMTYLHELYGFFIQQRDGYTIGELKNLKSICHLDVSGLDKVRNTEEAAEVMLDQKENLSAVTFSWSPPGPRDVLNVCPVSFDTCDASKAEQLLDKLQPHPNSSKLKIQGYPGFRSPCWLESPKLINLTYLCICDCKRLQRLPPLGQLVSLQYLYIINLESVDLVDSSVFGSEKPYGLRSLKILEIEDMPICTEWVGYDGVNLFPRLDTLVVRDCQELKRLPNVPISIQHVEIYKAGLQAIPLPLFLGTSSSSPPSLSLSKLIISCCPNLATLWQGYSLPALEELSIQECASLSYLPEDSFCSPSTLKNLEIVKCPTLMTRKIWLPPTVRYFTLGWCGHAEAPLIHSLQGLKSLIRLILDGYAMPLVPCKVFESLTGLISVVFSDCAITSLPSAEAFARLTNLDNLTISHCKELVSLDGIQGLDSLTFLDITGCGSLVQHLPGMVGEGADPSGCALKLSELDIDHPSLLLKEPLRSITTVKRLLISGGSELTLLPEEWLLRNCQALEEVVVRNASHLQHLPQETSSLTSLRSLEVFNANLIQMLPDMPASLSNLRITNCHSNLKERYKKNVGPDWGKVAHIRNVDIS